MAIGQVTGPFSIISDKFFLMLTNILLKSSPHPLDSRKFNKILPSISMRFALKMSCIFLLSTVVIVTCNRENYITTEMLTLKF